MRRTSLPFNSYGQYRRLIIQDRQCLHVDEALRFELTGAIVVTKSIEMKKTIVVILLFLGLARIASAQRRDNPTVKETMRWMQTSLENGGGDYWIGHEVRSTRLEDFFGCGVHFSASTHQEPFANGEPAPDKKPTHIDYSFSLGDIDPATITFLKGLRLDAPSLMTIKTRNCEKKITTRFSWQSEVKAKPDDTYLIFTLDSIDADYVDRFTKAFKHAVEACGGKPSFFAESIKVDSDGRASPAAGGVAAQSAAPRKDIPSIAKAASGAIVTIVMANNDKPIARGTGFLVSSDGVIVTNYHVIANGNTAIVKFSDGTTLPVDGVLVTDKVRDLAVIKIHGKNVRALTLGNSDRVQIGEEVIAIGNPLGLELTVSNGILSGFRTVEKERGKFLQITAPISHGSSGGPTGGHSRLAHLKTLS